MTWLSGEQYLRGHTVATALETAALVASLSPTNERLTPVSSGSNTLAFSASATST